MKEKRVTGIFHRNPKGFGFVTPDKEGADFFVPAAMTGGALTDDRVEVERISDSDPRGDCVVVRRIVERARKSCIGVLAYGEEGEAGIRPLRRDLPEFIPFVRATVRQAEKMAKEGDWLEAEFAEERHGRLQVRPSQRMKVQGSVEAELDAISKEYGIPARYSVAQEKAAQLLVPQEISREDCRKLVVFTCDPMDARDYDDALSLQNGSKKGEVVLGVHIADVACYVTPGSPLDEEARNRSFTTYLPGRTIGMLPDALAADLCSLREGVDRLAHTVFITVKEATGEIVKSRRCHTLICSSKRLCYEQVDRLLQGEKIEGISPALTKTLTRLDQVTARMRQWRQKNEKFIPLEIPEIRVLCAGNPPKVAGLSGGNHGRSGEIIEECMLAANVEVAKELKAKKIPGMFRNHLAPEREKLEELEILAQAVTGQKRNLKLYRRPSLVDFLATLAGKPEGEVLMLSFLRMMPRAEYGSENKGHFGLGKEIYSHFTSPIRRYTDLETHQQLILADQRQTLMKNSALRKVVNHCNAREIIIDQACFAAEDRLKIHLLQEKPGKLYHAVVCRITPAGMGIYLPEMGLMGFIDLAQLGRADLHCDRLGLQLLQSGRPLFCYGDKIQVKVKRCDLVRGEVVYQCSGLPRGRKSKSK